MSSTTRSVVLTHVEQGTHAISGQVVRADGTPLHPPADMLLECLPATPALLASRHTPPPFKEPRHSIIPTPPHPIRILVVGMLKFDGLSQVARRKW